MVGIAVIALGATLVTVTFWSRAGRTPAARWWVGPANHMNERAVLAVFPGFGLACVCAGILTFVPAGSVWSLAVTTVAIAGLLLALLGILGIRAPARVLPEWARQGDLTDSMRGRKRPQR